MQDKKRPNQVPAAQPKKKQRPCGPVSVEQQQQQRLQQEMLEKIPRQLEVIATLQKLQQQQQQQLQIKQEQETICQNRESLEDQLGAKLKKECNGQKTNRARCRELDLQIVYKKAQEQVRLNDFRILQVQVQQQLQTLVQKQQPEQQPQQLQQEQLRLSQERETLWCRLNLVLRHTQNKLSPHLAVGLCEQIMDKIDQELALHSQFCQLQVPVQQLQQLQRLAERVARLNEIVIQQQQQQMLVQQQQLQAPVQQQQQQQQQLSSQGLAPAAGGAMGDESEGGEDLDVDDLFEGIDLSLLFSPSEGAKSQVGSGQSSLDAGAKPGM